MKTNNDFLIKLRKTHNDNLDFIEDLITYLNNPFSLINTPKSNYDHEVKDELVDSFIKNVKPLNNAANTKKYLNMSLCLKNSKKYKSNPYLRLLRNIQFSYNELELSWVSIKPYEIFVAGDAYMQADDNKYFAQLGYLKEEYSYPSLSLCGREWMSLCPNEIETMDLPLKVVSGKILVLGLGLGYFTYIASLKNDVDEIYVVEMDKDIISLFIEKILPKFEHKEKIHIIKDDAFKYIRSIKDKDFDYIYSDLWHDTSDGVEMYLRLKSRLDDFKYTRCIYWIEESIITQLELYVTGALLNDEDTPLKRKLNSLNLNSIYDYRKVFTFQSLLKLFKK